MLQPRKTRQPRQPETRADAMRLTMTDHQMDHWDTKTAQPWTTADYERVRRAVLALAKTKVTLEMNDGELRPSFDGPAWWNVLGALDRDRQCR